MLIACIYGAILAGALGPLNGFWSSDQGTKLIQVQSLIRQKYRSNALLYPGAIYDPEQRASPLRGAYFAYRGNVYSAWPAAFAVASSAPFFLFGFPGLYVLPLVSALGVLWLCAAIGRHLFAEPWVVGAVLLCGLASPLFFYGVNFWEHAPATCLVMLAVWWAVRCAAMREARPLFLAGVALSGAVWLRVETALCVVALGLALFLAWPDRKGRAGAFAWLCVGAAPGVAALLAFQRAVYGTFLGPHILIAGGANGVVFDPQGFARARLAWAEMLLAPSYGTIVAAGTLALVALRIAAQFARHRRALYVMYGLALAIMAVVGVAAAILLASGAQTNPELNGGEQTALILTCPLVLLCLLPASPAERNGEATPAMRSARLLLCFALCFIAGAWLLGIPWGASQWGPRVLLPAIPPLLLAGLYRASRWFSRAAGQPFGVTLSLAAVIGGRRVGGRGAIEPVLGAVMALLVTASVLSEAYGLQALRRANERNHRITTAVAQSNQRVIITDSWYAPPVIAPLYFDDRLVYLVDTGGDLDTLLDSLAAHGIMQFYYLGARAEAVSAGSTRWRQLTPIGTPDRFAYHLAGTAYQVTPGAP